MEISERKKMLRQEVMKKRRMLKKEDIQNASANALFHLLQTPEYIMSTSVFVYVSYGHELSTFPLIHAAFLDGKIVAVPKVISKHTMEFYRLRSLSELTAGYSGIPEPDGTQQIMLPKKNDIMILPGLLFDRTGKRMGYGGGFYDTYIGRCRQAGEIPVLAGYTYDFQLFAPQHFSAEAFGDGNFPAEEHDQRVHILLTPSEIIYTKEYHENIICQRIENKNSGKE